MTHLRPGRQQRVRGYTLLLMALCISGAAGLINQIGWQRAVKVYLANSEELSSMIVVLVFMLGLGAGSVAASRRSTHLRNPLRTLALVELGLALINAGLLLLFGDHLRRLAHSLQASAVAAGFSTSLLYAVLSFAVLLLPCFLMGVTMPLAAEAAQRQLKLKRASTVAEIFAVNTVGAVVGAFSCGFLLLPLFGQKVALGLAASANLAAALVAFALSRIQTAPSQPAEPRRTPQPASFSVRQLREEELLALGLGFISLSFEIYLFRVFSLAYTPLPWIFTFVLCAFLLVWSVGVELSARVQVRTTTALSATALAIVVLPALLAYQRTTASIDVSLLLSALYFLPCLGFGYLFGQTVSRYAATWGRDVGVFTALNTGGSAMGILATTLVFFAFGIESIAWILGAALVAFIPYHNAREKPGSTFATRASVRAGSAVVGALLGLLLLAEAVSTGPVQGHGRLQFFGRDGVVEIAPDQRVYINGLWHSVLFRDDDEAAKRTPNVQRKTLIAVLPLLAHGGHEPREVLNIGMGTGATARTMAKSESVRSVDTYEIVTTLKDVIAMFPDETLGRLNRDKIDVFWRDARTGLITNPKKYDVITQSPLYLRQSGSAFLLSREYFRLLRSRLKPGGVAGIYCNTMGNEAQALVVRRTVAEVFPYTESYENGYFLLASMDPIDLRPATVAARFSPEDPLQQDLQRLDIDRILENFDSPRLDWSSTDRLITDDHPLVEYPILVSWLVGSERKE